MVKRILIGVSVGTLLLVLLILGHNWIGTPSHNEPVAAQPTQQNDTSSGLTFHGYDCTVDCSGHEAGYQWAEEHDIKDADDCGGNSQSFIEGCRAYAEEQGDANDNDDGDNSSEE